MKKILIYAGIPVSILFLWLALKDVSFSHVAQAFANARLILLVPMLLCLVGFYWLKAVRWRAILSPKYDVSSINLVPSMMAGSAGNNLLPAHAGELVRVYFAASQFKIPATTVLASLVVERLLDVLAVLVILSVEILFGGYSVAMLAAGSALLAIVLVVAAVCVLIVIYTNQCADFLRNKFTRASLSIRNKLADQLINLADGLLSLREKNLLLKVILNSLVQWLLTATCIYISFLALNIDTSFWLAIIVLGLIVVGLTLPTVPGFFGTIEYCFVLGLSTAGVDPNLAISAGIFYHIPIWAAVTLTGLLMAHYHSFSLGKLLSNAKI